MFLVTAQALGLAALTADPGRIAVYDPSATAASWSARLATEDVVRVEPWPVRGWWLLETHDASALADRLARSGAAGFVSEVRRGLDGGPVFATPDLLLRFRPETPVAEQRAVLDALERFVVVEERFGAWDGAYRLRTTSHDARDVVRAAHELARRADVLAAEPDCVFTGRGGTSSTSTPVTLPPTDPSFASAWWLANTGQSGGTPGVDMDVLPAWPRLAGFSSAILAVIDTGVDVTNPDLAPNTLPGFDFTSDGPAGQGAPINGFDNHGTPVAGCAVAAWNNGSGACGIAPEARCISMRAFITVAADGSWTSATSWTVNALTAAQTSGARVTNNSNTYGFTSPFIDQKYLDTRNAGLVHFASAGNAAAAVVDYPASLPTVNAVGSIASTGGHSSFSNLGALAFVAPGEGVLSTDRSGAAGYTTSDSAFVVGTSFASPMVAGVALLLVSADPTRTPAQIEAALIGSCDDLGAPGLDVVFGNGLPSAVRALDQLLTPPVSFCVGAPNSVGPGATMSWVGVPTACLNALTLVASGCPPNGFGVFFLGNAPVQTPFGNGFRCAGGAVWRFPVVTTSPFGDASFTPDWSTLGAGFTVAPGQTRYAQFWYRDAFAVGAPFNLSDGLQIDLGY